jgi:molybdopterin-binding protein
MDTLTANEAASLLRVNAKRIQSLARSGKLPGVRVGRKWLFQRRDIERLLGRTAPRAPFDSLSARNHLAGEIAGLRSDGLMCEVRLRIGEQELVSVITRSSADRLGLKVGDRAYAVIKSTEVMIGKDPE